MERMVSIVSIVVGAEERRDSTSALVDLRILVIIEEDDMVANG